MNLRVVCGKSMSQDMRIVPIDPAVKIGLMHDDLSPNISAHYSS